MSVLSRVASSSPQQKPIARRQAALKAAPKSKLRHEDSQVDFTAVESSSPVAMESQLLTEHQREVKSRQQFETAPLYPEFSSSPGPRRRASKSGLPLLDFSSQQAVMDTGYATPTLHDDHGPMDEYITSSPTPKAAEKLQPSAVENTDVDNSAFEAEDNDIPSSPPEMADETVYDGTTELENLQTTEDQEMSDIQFDTVPEDLSTVVPQEESRVDDSRPLPEEAAAVEQATNAPAETHPSIKRLVQNPESCVSSDVFTDARSELNPETTVKNDAKDGDEVTEKVPEDQDALESDDSSPIPFTDSLSEQLQQEPKSSAEVPQSKAPEAVATPGDISRVMDSFVETNASDDDDDTTSVQQEIHTSPPTKPNPTPSASKRKREEPQETRASAKRRKSSASPFRRIVTRTISYLTGSQVAKDDDEDDDEEIQDCIVVGSQRDEEEEDSQSEAAEQSPIPESAPASAAPSTSKRTRGRPRKSTTPVVSSPVSYVRTRASKRRASTLDAEENQDSLVIDTPAPTKSRRTTRSQDAKTGQPVEHVMLSPTPRRRGRELEAVLISPRPPGVDESLIDESLVDETAVDETTFDEQAQDDNDDEQEDDEQDDNQEAEAQLRHEEERAVHDESPDRGNWLISKVKHLVINCRTMVITPQQERELQDLLYELGKCVYEAGRRSSA
jgi:hypothetical protein